MESSKNITLPFFKPSHIVLDQRFVVRFRSIYKSYVVCNPQVVCFDPDGSTLAD